MKAANADVGVIVGRFQVPELHAAHLELFDIVLDRHGKVIVFLGLAPVLVTRENPLDFESRKQMILDAFPQVSVLYIKDVVSDEIWSGNLDSQIADLVTPSQSVLLYGGRDSFIKHYSGKHSTEELESAVIISGSEIRKEVSRKSVRGTPDFRAGVVWAAYSQYPMTMPTVDIAIFNEDYTKILLGKKSGEDKYRFIGGFADPSSPTYEADARREAREETGLDVTDPVYVASFSIDDWRYRREPDRKIKTLLFAAKVFSGSPKAADDIAEVRWFDVAYFEHEGAVLNFTDANIVVNHLPFIGAIRKYLNSHNIAITL